MREILRLSVPLACWLAGFSAVYALQALSCSRHWPEGLPVRPLLLLGWGLTMALQATLLWAILRDPGGSPFLRFTGRSLAIVALVASVWTLMPVALTSVCL